MHYQSQLVKYTLCNVSAFWCCNIGLSIQRKCNCAVSGCEYSAAIVVPFWAGGRDDYELPSVDCDVVVEMGSGQHGAAQVATSTCVCKQEVRLQTDCSNRLPHSVPCVTIKQHLVCSTMHCTAATQGVFVLFCYEHALAVPAC